MTKSSVSNTCLNCSTVFVGNYCPECAQASGTGRMSFGRLFAKDFLASVFNLNRGFFRTCLELITKPGELVKNYLAGKRVPYFHFAGLFFVLLTIDALLLSFATNSEFTILTNELPSTLEGSDFTSSKGWERGYDFYKFALAFSTPLLAMVPYFLF